MVESLRVQKVGAHDQRRNAAADGEGAAKDVQAGYYWTQEYLSHLAAIILALLRDREDLVAPS